MPAATGARAPTRRSATRAATTASAMEGYFWRITEPRRGDVVVVLAAVNRDARGRDVGHGRAGGAPRRPRARRDGRPRRRPRAPACGCAWRRRRPHGARGGRATGCASTSARRAPRRRLRRDAAPGRGASSSAGSGPAQVVPGLSQYWHPAPARRARRGAAASAARALDARRRDAPTPRRTGARAGMPPEWWWGQAHGFARDRTRAWRSRAAAPASARCASPRRPRSSSRSAATSCASCAPPGPLRVTVEADGWRLRGRTAPGTRVEVEGHAGGTAPHLLPGPAARGAPPPRRRRGAAPRRHAARPRAPRAAARCSRGRRGSRASSAASAAQPGAWTARTMRLDPSPRRDLTGGPPRGDREPSDSAPIRRSKTPDDAPQRAQPHRRARGRPARRAPR